MNDTIHIALAVYDPKGTYSRHAGVVMASTFSNTKSRVCFHILHDETLSGENRENFVSLTQKFNQEIHFVNVGEHLTKFGVDIDKLTRSFSRGSLFRLFITELLPFDKIIYLDCDVVVNLDIRELWELHIGDSCVAAVFDTLAKKYIAGKHPQKRRLFFCRVAGIKPEAYFASGALLINSRKIRENIGDVVRKAGDFFVRYACSLFPDQDFLNFLLQNDCFIMDDKFSYFGESLDYSNLNGKIWHFSGTKPWEAATNSKIDALYWKYLAITPWSSDIVQEIICSWEKSAYSHLHSKDCKSSFCKKIKISMSPYKITPIYKLMVMWNEWWRKIWKK